MLITLNISSRLDNTTGGASSSGSNDVLSLSLDDSQPIKHVIKRYCEAKAIEENPIFYISNEENRIFSKNKTLASLPIQNDEKLYIGALDPFATLRFGNWCSIATLALFLGICGIILCTCIYLLLKITPDSYAIVFDAGSTHTETLLYRWPSSKVNNTGIVSQIHSCSIEDGIANVLLSGNQSVEQYMDRCFRKETESIPAESLDESQVFFGGTAGMRLLRETNQSAATATMNKVVHYLHSSDLKFNESQAEILSGAKEGACGWITVNYLNQRIRSGKPTWGALDLGGASTQIAFETTAPTGSANAIGKALDTDIAITPIKLYGKSFHVFTRSFLCYGVFQAKLRYRASLILQQIDLTRSYSPSIPVAIQSPCEAFGKSSSLTLDGVFNTSCTNAFTESPSYKNNYANLPRLFTFVGTSESERCQTVIRHLMSKQFCSEMNIPDDKCLETGNIPPNYQNRSFQAFSGFGYIYQQLGLNSSSSTTREIFNSTAVQRCRYTYTELSQQALANRVKIQVLDELCFKGLYVFTLLNDVYKFDTEDAWSNIRFGIVVDGVSLGWAIGYMVNATESIASIPPIPSLDAITFTLLTILFIIFVTVGLGFIYHAIQMRRFLHHYQKVTLSA